MEKRTNYGKIIAITLAVIAAFTAIAFVVYKLIKKYTEELVCDCDDLLDEECGDCEIEIEEADEAELAAADAE